MAYSADTFVADEQPTTAKWNKLWSNDASFNDGTGIATGAITSAKISGIDKSLTTTDSNPYKFQVGRTAAYNFVATTLTKFPFDTERFDTNNNFDSTTNFRYTAPVDGYYFMHGRLGNIGASMRFIVLAYKNGTEYLRGGDMTAATPASVFAGVMQMTATDYAEMWYYSGALTAAEVTSAYIQSFGGFLVSRT
jgi:hypothetical protein